MAQKKIDPESEAALEIVKVELLREKSVAEEQKQREQMIAEANMMLGRIQTANMFGKLAVTSTFVWFKKVKESKVYKDIPNIGTWDSFCKSAGYSKRYVDEKIQELDVFGEGLLEV